jgi:hypothetical protein
MKLAEADEPVRQDHFILRKSSLGFTILTRRQIIPGAGVMDRPEAVQVFVTTCA